MNQALGANVNFEDLSVVEKAKELAKHQTDQSFAPLLKKHLETNKDFLNKIALENGQAAKLILSNPSLANCMVDDVVIAQILVKHRKSLGTWDHNKKDIEGYIRSVDRLLIKTSGSSSVYQLLKNTTCKEILLESGRYLSYLKKSVKNEMIKDSINFDEYFQTIEAHLKTVKSERYGGHHSVLEGALREYKKNKDQFKALLTIETIEELNDAALRVMIVAEKFAEAQVIETPIQTIGDYINTQKSVTNINFIYKYLDKVANEQSSENNINFKELPPDKQRDILSHLRKHGHNDDHEDKIMFRVFEEYAKVNKDYLKNCAISYDPLMAEIILSTTQLAPALAKDKKNLTEVLLKHLELKEIEDELKTSYHEFSVGFKDSKSKKLKKNVMKYIDKANNLLALTGTNVSKLFNNSKAKVELLKNKNFKHYYEILSNETQKLFTPMRAGKKETRELNKTKKDLKNHAKKGINYYEKLDLEKTDPSLDLEKTDPSKEQLDSALEHTINQINSDNPRDKEAQIKLAEQAHKVLSNPSEKKMYDDLLETQLAKQTAKSGTKLSQ